MLVCSIIYIPPRQLIADIDEIVAAADEFDYGDAILGLVLDEPASIDEIIDAFVGEPIQETASATDTVDTGGVVYAGEIAEDHAAADTPDANWIGDAGVTEAAAADDAPDGAVPVTYAAGVDEAASAADAPDAVLPATYAADVVETASAVDAPDAGLAIRTSLVTQQALLNYTNANTRTSLVTIQVLRTIT